MQEDAPAFAPDTVVGFEHAEGKKRCLVGLEARQKGARAVVYARRVNGGAQISKNVMIYRARAARAYQYPSPPAERICSPLGRRYLAAHAFGSAAQITYLPQRHKS